MKWILFFILTFSEAECWPPQLYGDDYSFVQRMSLFMGDIIQDTTRRISLLQTMQKRHSDCVQFEVGYLVYIIQNKYKKMVDYYQTCSYMLKRLYNAEHVLYLHDIEHIYWEITHIINMLHEIERKYKHVDTTTTLRSETTDNEGGTTGNGTVTDKQKSSKFTEFVTVTKLKTRRTKFVADKYIKEVSVVPNGLKILRPQDRIINELSWGTKVRILKDYPVRGMRRVGMSYLRDRVDTTPYPIPTIINVVKTEDSSMKMKLFRLMYETVRDSDLKVKRAELIKSYYANYSSFEIGFIMGDITDKFNVMNDISLTLQRLYKEWKPMEHINAYEQIANKGIEISHLIDIIRIINKRTPKTDD